MRLGMIHLAFAVAGSLLLAPLPSASAQHLWWSATYKEGKKEKKVEKMTFLYGEIEVLRSGPTIYYCGVNWQPGRPAGGYCGIQDHGKGRRWTIFSVWDTSRKLHPKVVAWDERTAHGRFGGEGEGAHTHMEYPWKAGEVFRFAVTKRLDKTKKNTLVSFYFYDRTQKKWVLQAVISSPGAHLDSVRWFGGSMNSFLENWSGRKRKLPKVCLYRLWAGTSPKDLHFLRRATGDGYWGILTRIIHQAPAANPDRPAIPGVLGPRLLDVLSNTPPGLGPAGARTDGPLRVFATDPGE